MKRFLKQTICLLFAAALAAGPLAVSVHAYADVLLHWDGYNYTSEELTAEDAEAYRNYRSTAFIEDHPPGRGFQVAAEVRIEGGVLQSGEKRQYAGGYGQSILLYGTVKYGETLRITWDADFDPCSGFADNCQCTVFASVEIRSKGGTVADDSYGLPGSSHHLSAEWVVRGDEYHEFGVGDQVGIYAYAYGGIWDVPEKGPALKVLLTVVEGDDEALLPVGDTTIHSDASERAGEDGGAFVAAGIVEGIRQAGVPAAIAVGAAAAAVGVGAAGVAAGAGRSSSRSGDEPDEEKRRSRYKMYVRKDFGDKIRYGPTPVFVYARMAELPPGGGERDRPDLTARISIAAGSPGLEVHPPLIRGGYMAATVYAHSEQHESTRPAEGVISFRFSGEGGSFQSNVRFQLIGTPRLRVENAWLLAEEGATAELPFTLEDFVSPNDTQIMFSMNDAALPFTVALERTHATAGVLRVTGSSTEPDGSFRHFHGVLTAQSHHDEAQEHFVITLCREGLYLDFGTRDNRHDIRCYPDENGALPITRVGIGLAIWDEGAKRLAMLPPAELSVRCEDEKQAGERIGLVWSATGESMPGRQLEGESLAVWEVRAKKLLPYPDDVKATLHVRAAHGGREYTGEFAAVLTTDSIHYYDSYDKQWGALWNLLECAFSPRADHLREQLLRIRDKMGLADFQLYEKKLRGIIQAELESDSAQRMADVAFYDSCIDFLESVEFWGGICRDILLSIYTGPMFGLCKDILVDVAMEYFTNPKFKASDVPYFVLKNVSGNADNVFDFPQPGEYKKMGLWLAAFFCYRVVWHWQFDYDNHGKPKGLWEAVKSAAIDLTLKATLELWMKDYLKQSPQSDTVFGQDVTKVKELAAKDEELFGTVRDQAKKTGGELLDSGAQYAKDAAAHMKDSAGRFVEGAKEFAGEYTKQCTDALWAFISSMNSGGSS